MAALNEPAEAVLRANTLKTGAEELAARLDVPSHPAPGLPEGLVLDGPFDAFESPLWTEGLFMPQSRAAMAVGHALAPRPGERVLDLCAAPGGKTTHLAALMGDRGELVAVERHPGRADALRRTAARMGAAVDVRTADAAAFTADAAVRPRAGRPAVLRPRHARLPPGRPLAQAGRPAGAPRRACSGRSSTRARARPARAAPSCTRPAPSRPRRTPPSSRPSWPPRPDFEPAGTASDMPLWDDPRVPGFSQTLPHRDGTEGFFVARLRRREAA